MPKNMVSIYWRFGTPFKHDGNHRSSNLHVTLIDGKPDRVLLPNDHLDITDKLTLAQWKTIRARVESKLHPN
jgi:hypothetical protein